MRTSIYSTTHERAIGLWDVRPDGSVDADPPRAILTVADETCDLGEDEILVKTWSENRMIAGAALLSGYFVDTGRRHQCGYVEASVWRICAPPRP